MILMKNINFEKFSERYVIGYTEGELTNADPDTGHFSLGPI